jgi:hypothetical protein
MKALGMLVGILMLAAVSTSHASFVGTYKGSTTAKISGSVKTLAVVVKIASTGAMTATVNSGSTSISAPKGKLATTGEFVLADYRNDHAIAIGGVIKGTTVGGKSTAIYFSPDGQSKQFTLVKQ